MSGRQGQSVLGRRSGGKSEVEYQRLGAQVQNVKKSSVYIFGDDDICEDEDIVEFEMENIRSRKGLKNHELRKEPSSLFIERKIAEGDTLQSLSLLYSCPVSELKRVNNLIRDQEFYALTVVKIPVKKHSFLLEKNDKVENVSKIGGSKEHTERTKVSNGAAYISDDEVYHEGTDSESVHDMSDPETQKLLIRKISIGHTSQSQSREARQFLESMDKDLSKLRSSTRTDRDSLDEVISVLTNKSVYPLVQPRKSQMNGTDCGLTWKSVLVVVLVLGVLIPLGYLLYFLTKYYILKDDKKL